MDSDAPPSGSGLLLSWRRLSYLRAMSRIFDRGSIASANRSHSPFRVELNATLDLLL